MLLFSFVKLQAKNMTGMEIATAMDMKVVICLNIQSTHFLGSLILIFRRFFEIFRFQV